MPHAELSAYAVSNQSPTKPMREHSRPKPTKTRKPPKQAAFQMHLVQNQLLQQMTTSS